MVQAFIISLFAWVSSLFIMASIVRLDMFPAIVAYSIVPLFDGPALCAWKAVGRISDQFETRMQISQVFIYSSSVPLTLLLSVWPRPRPQFQEKEEEKPLISHEAQIFEVVEALRPRPWPRPRP